MKRTKKDIEMKKYRDEEHDKMIHRLKNGKKITNYQGYGQESCRGCFCCGGANNLSAKHIRGSKNTATWKRCNRAAKKRQRRLNKIVDMD